MFHTLTRKVTLATVAFVALLTLVAVLVITSITAVDRATDHVTQHGIAYLTANADFHEDLELIGTSIEFFVLRADQESRDEIEEAFGEAEDALPTLATMGATLGTRFQTEFAQIHTTRVALLAELEPLARAVVDAVDRNDPAATQRALQSFEAFNERIGQLEDDSDALIARELDAATNTISQLTLRGLGSSIGGLVITAGAGLLLVLLLARRVVQPLRTLSAASKAVAAGDLHITVPVTDSDELGDLQRAFNHMTRTLYDQTQQLADQVTVAQAAQTEAEAARSQVHEQLAMIADQQDMIRDMSVPVLPVTGDTFVMPLVGALDAARLALVQSQALAMLERAGARHLIMDVTGVPVIDTNVAQGLLQVVQAARLLGAEVILVGIRPEVAQTVVSLGIDLRNVRTQPSLQSAIVRVVQPQRKQG